ncbi:unnamed protein product [Acanthosepion pharaonis]|uniref:Uncharacterized protein n=1 Tax=Acanthosepion pharaonis TaxID=158019 RepID=A0A812D013_ACAPH|nr:unnamed protein product [Sepia pharaonis]
MGFSYCKTCSSIVSGHKNIVANCAFDANNRNLATTGWDKWILIWDVATGKYRNQGPEHTGWVEDVGISQNQEWLVSCSKDQTVRIWNIKNINTIQRTNKSEQNVTQIMQCEKCLKPFIPAPDIRGHNLLMCLYCKLDLNAEKESKSSTNT